MKAKNDSKTIKPGEQIVTLSARQIRRTSTRTQATIGPLTRAHRARILRRLKLSPSELTSVGRGHLEIYARAASKLDLADAFFEQHEFIGEDGSMTAIAQHYSTLLNSASRALKALESHLEAEREPSMVMLMQQGARELERRNGS